MSDKIKSLESKRDSLYAEYEQYCAVDTDDPEILHVRNRVYAKCVQLQGEINDLKSKLSMNIAHLAFYANRVLEDLGVETLPVAFWRGLYEGRGDISTVPDYLL